MKKCITVLIISFLALAMLVNVGCKKKQFDITGPWLFYIFLQGETFEEEYTFQGDRYSGDVLWQGSVLGTYSVSDDYISFTLDYYDQDDDYVVEVYRGYVDSDTEMSGTVNIVVEGYSAVEGTWEAVY